MTSEVDAVCLDHNQVQTENPLTNQEEQEVKLSSRLRTELDPKKLEVLQTDTKSPLYSVKSFEELGLSESLLKGIYDQKYNKPSHIQEVALPTIIHKSHEHFIGQAQSGTGKTAAFALGMLQRVESVNHIPQALCICPTRELARQIYDAVSALAKFTDIKIFLAVPGYESSSSDRSQLTQHIVLGTPGTVWSLIKSRRLPIKSVQIFVVDEADKMIDVDDGLWKITESIRKSLNPTCQICLFSATYSDIVRKHAQRLVPEKPGRTIVTLEPEELSLDKIQEFYIDCKDPDLRYKCLADIMPFANVGSTVIFVRLIRTADQLAQRLIDDGFPVSVIHGGKDMEPHMRDKVMDDFRNFRTRILIATDVLARGIDVSEVTLVINYDLPIDRHGMPDPQTYLHRIGRSGRFGRDGLAINFVYDLKSKEELKSINKYLHHSKNGARREITELHADNLPKLEKMLEDLD